MCRAFASLLLTLAVTGCALPVPISAPRTAMGPSGVSPIPPAPSVPARVDPIVCSSAAADLLPSLNGDWILQGGERTVWGSTEDGSITLRLPGQEPAVLVFEYAPERGMMDVYDAERDNQMFMFPATADQLGAAEMLIGGEEGASASGSGCGWYDAPIFIGTNYYYAEDEVTLDDTGRWLPACTLLAISVYYFDPEVRRSTPTPSRFEFEMEMTLVVRFSSTDHASGMLYFEGTGENTEFGAGGPDQTMSEFRARAPVELTR
jgi:hypothetical protein